MNVTETTIKERSWAYNQRFTSRYERPYAYSIVYVDFGETVLEHLENRRNRPYNLLKPIIARELTARGIEFSKIRWNRYAGCSMCPCSGGFIIEGHRSHTIWMTVTQD